MTDTAITYKAGDRVRLLNDLDCYDLAAGTIREIVEVHPTREYGIKLARPVGRKIHNAWVKASEVEPAPVAQRYIPPLLEWERELLSYGTSTIEADPPRPLVVGDRVQITYGHGWNGMGSVTEVRTNGTITVRKDEPVDGLLVGDVGYREGTFSRDVLIYMGPAPVVFQPGDRVVVTSSGFESQRGYPLGPGTTGTVVGPTQGDYRGDWAITVDDNYGGEGYHWGFYSRELALQSTD